MTNPNLTEIIAIMDRSGSMASLKLDVEGGFDNYIAEQKKLPGEARLTFVQFDSSSIQTVHENLPLSDFPGTHLHPGGSTPLLDAVGETINRVGARLSKTDEDKRPGKVIVVIMTDGEENASHRFTKDQIKAMVELQTQKYQWQFTFIGAGIDAFAEAGGIGIAAAAASPVAPSAVGARVAFMNLNSASSRYRTGAAADMSYTVNEQAAAASTYDNTNATP